MPAAPRRLRVRMAPMQWSSCSSQGVQQLLHDMCITRHNVIFTIYERRTAQAVAVDGPNVVEAELLKEGAAAARDHAAAVLVNLCRRLLQPCAPLSDADNAEGVLRRAALQRWHSKTGTHCGGIHCAPSVA